MVNLFKNKKGLESAEIFLAVILVLFGIGSRFLPHPFNFTSIAAVALFGGVYLSLWLGLTLPLIALLISDFFIGFYEPTLMFFVYLSFALVGLIGWFLKKHKSWYGTILASISGSVLFFIISNFSVWAFTPWYEKTMTGLTKCFAMALPFFRNSLLGDLFYVGVLFGAYELSAYLLKRFLISKSEIIR